MRANTWTFTLLAAGALAVTAPACRSTPAAAPDQAAPAKKMTCFNARDINSFVPLSGPYLYVRVGTREQHYLLTLDRDSEPLRNAEHIMISPGFDQVCSGIRTAMTYDYLGVVGVYNITDVTPVKNQAEAEAIAAARAGARPRAGA